MQPITLAFAGTANTTLPNVEALLNDWLGFGAPDEEGYYAPSEREINLIFAFPNQTVPEGIKTVFEWSARANLAFAAVHFNEEPSLEVGNYLNDADEVSADFDVAAGTISALSGFTGEKYLILLNDPDADELDTDTEAFLDAAIQSEIPAKDLCAGLDDISFMEPNAPAPEPVEVEPATSAVTIGEELADEEVPLSDEVNMLNPHTPAPASEIETLGYLLDGAIADVNRYGSALRKAVEAKDTDGLAAPVVDAETQKAASEEEETRPYLKYPDGTYKPRRRGRQPNGTVIVQLTKAGVTAAGFDWED